MTTYKRKTRVRPLLVERATAIVKSDELTTSADELGYPFVRVPSGTTVEIIAGPNPYVYLTKGKGETFYMVRFDGKRVAIASSNLRSRLGGAQ